jgi:CRISPR/Cas system-associated exonuclease Cas4 (RecB family)
MDWSQFDFTNPTISNSKIETILNCSLKYRFNYEDKLPTEPARALELGRTFDHLCDVGTLPEKLELLSDEDLSIVYARYHEYKKIMPTGRKQVPFQKSVGYKDWSIIGFVDLIPDGFPNAPIVDIKFSEKKWTAKKASYKTLQASIYAWAFDHDHFQYHVMNYAKPGLQTYPFNIGEIEVDQMLDKAVRAIRMIEEGIRKPEENPLCGWCDYQLQCVSFNKDKEN